MIKLLMALILAGSTLQTQAPPTAPGVAAKPVEDPAVTALARTVYRQMRAGKVDEALLTAEMNKEFRPSVLAETKPMFDTLGDPTKLELLSRTPATNGTRWEYLATFAAAQLHVKILVTKSGKVGGYKLSL